MLSHLESERLMPLLVKQVKKLSHGHCCLQLCWAASCVFFPGVFFSNIPIPIRAIRSLQIGFHGQKPHSATQKWMC